MKKSRLIIICLILFILPLVCFCTIVIISFVKNSNYGDPYKAEFIVISLDRGECMVECNPYLLAVNNDGVVGIYESQDDPLRVNLFKLKNKFTISKDDFKKILQKFKDVNFLSYSDNPKSLLRQTYSATEEQIIKIKFEAISPNSQNDVLKEVSFEHGDIPELDNLANYIDQIAKK